MSMTPITDLQRTYQAVHGTLICVRCETNAFLRHMDALESEIENPSRAWARMRASLIELEKLVARLRPYMDALGRNKNRTFAEIRELEGRAWRA